MSLLYKPLPINLSANIEYQAIAVENSNYDPVNRQYTARVYGVCNGKVMPLIVNTRVQLHRIEEVVITDDEIDAILVERPELNNDRVAAAMTRAFIRLYSLAAETPEAPYRA